MNKVIITGNLCKEIELKKSQSGKSFVKNSVAVKRTMKNQDGEYETDFFNITVFGVQAEFLEKYAGKGSKVLVEGTLQFSKYQNKDGLEVNTHDLMVSSIELQGTKEKSNSEPKNSDYIDPSKLANTLEIDEDELPFSNLM